MQRRMIRMTPARRSKMTGRVFYEIYRYEDTGKLYPYSCNFAVHAWRICLHHDLQQYRKSGIQQHDRFGAGRGGARILGDAFLYQHCKGAWHKSQLSDSSTSDSELSEIVQQIIERHELQKCNIIKPNGESFDGNNYSDREYFQNAMKGNVTVTEPIVSRVTGELMIIIAAPIWKNGITDGETVGCITIVPDPEFLNDIVRSIKVSDNCGAYIIDKNGNTIADLDSDLVKRGENIEQLAAADTSGQAGYKTLAKAHESMRAGESGVARYTLNGVSKFLSYAPIQTAGRLQFTLPPATLWTLHPALL